MPSQMVDGSKAHMSLPVPSGLLYLKIHNAPACLRLPSLTSMLHETINAKLDDGFLSKQCTDVLQGIKGVWRQVSGSLGDA